MDALLAILMLMYVFGGLIAYAWVDHRHSHGAPWAAFHKSSRRAEWLEPLALLGVLLWPFWLIRYLWMVRTGASRREKMPDE